MITFYDAGNRYRVIHDDEPFDKIHPRYAPKNAQVNAHIDAGIEAGTHALAPISEYQVHYAEKRIYTPIEEGGYGSLSEQLELLYDKIKESGAVAGLEYYVSHIDQVKNKFPKE